MDLRRLFALAMLASLACSPDLAGLELPELQYEGEHVRVGTDFDVPICAGTIADFDREIERIEARLELGAEGKTDMWILSSRERYEHFCPESSNNCVPESVDGTLLRRHQPIAMWHALAHDRVNRAERPLWSSHPFFIEGLSEALGRAYCKPGSQGVLPSVATMLDPEEHSQFEFYEIYVAAQLTRWLIDTHGAQALQDFMLDVANDDDPEQVRAAYQAAFGSSLDEDPYAHIDWSVASRHPSEIGCRGEPPPVDASGSVYSLQANLDCDSVMIRSNWYESRPEHMYQGWAEWRLEVESGGFYDLVGEVPENTKLMLSRCDCEDLDGSYWQGPDPTNGHVFTGEHLGVGVYRLVWKGPLDPEQTLDVQIVRH